MATAPASTSWWIPSPDYMTPAMQAGCEAGEDYSYLQSVGLAGNRMLSRSGLLAPGLKFDLPISIIEGEQFLITTPDIAQK